MFLEIAVEEPIKNVFARPSYLDGGGGKTANFRSPAVPRSSSSLFGVGCAVLLVGNYSKSDFMMPKREEMLSPPTPKMVAWWVGGLVAEEEEEEEEWWWWW